MSDNQELKLNEEEQIEVTVERKLVALYTLQQIDSKIDRIRIVRGELPEAVQDLEDEVAGLETRIENYNADLKKFNTDVTNYKIKIKETQACGSANILLLFLFPVTLQAEKKKKVGGVGEVSLHLAAWC